MENLTRLKETTQVPLPPMVSGAPILGSARGMLKDPLMFMVRAHEQYGPIFRVRALHLEYTILAGLEANQFLAREGSKHLTVKQVYAGVTTGLQSDNFILGHDGKKHRELRSILRRGYSKTAVIPSVPLIIQLTQEMARTWPKGERVFIVPALKRLITKQLGQVLLQYDAEGYFEDLQKFFTITAETTTSHQLPEFVLKLPYFRRIQSRLFGLVDKVMAARAAAPPDPERRTLIDDVLAAVDDQGQAYPPDLLRAAIIGTYIAGIDTVALTCCFAVYALLKHPHVWERVVAEVRPIFQRTATPTMDDLKEMKVLHAALLENLRYYSVGPGTPRTASEDFEFGGYRIAKGSNVLVGTAVTHFQPQFFPDPLTFDLDRYLEPRHEHRQPNVFVPFTVGEHTCLGAGMAEIQVMATIAALINELDLTLDPLNYEIQYKTAPSRGPRHDLAVRVQ